ncbi:MAG: hypothetical protein IT345_03520, partial [Trueperaceae bacterium]|nr:hypothetical protein [Trueperaceae bacterium]
MSATQLNLDLKTMLEEMIPFNKLLGVRLVSTDPEAGRLVLEMPLREELIGNAYRGIVHG